MGLESHKLLKSWSELPFAFGGAAISGEGGGYGFGKTEATPEELIQYTYDQGIRIFDSAPIYGFGTSEEILGRCLKNVREKVCIISKSGVHWHENRRVDMSNDPKIARGMLEDSLRRLDSDYIDLYMVHWPDEKVDIRRTIEVLAKAQDEGKIKHLGLCNTFVEDLSKAQEVASIEVIQSEFSIFNHSARDLAVHLSPSQSFMSWGTLDKGILTGRVTKKREQSKDYDENDCRRSAPWWQQKEVLAKIDKVPALFKLWEEFDLSPLEAALSYNLSHDFCDTILMGAKSIADWEAVFKARTKVFSSDELKKIDELS